MKRFLPPAICALLCAACVIACSKQSNESAPENAEALVADEGHATEPAKPANPMDKPWAEWVAQSPMRQKMRAMWLDCGLIVGNSMYPDVEGLDLGLLRLSAEDVASKAAGFAQHFEKIRALNRQAASAAGESDWRQVGDRISEAEMACEGCHFENWSMATRGVLPETLKGWVDNDTVFGDEPWGDMKLNGAPAWIGNMFGMRARIRGVRFLAARRPNKQRILDATKDIHEFVDDQARRWREIEAQANAISRAAKTGALWEVEGHYITMRRNCIECHDKFAPDRGLAPMPWK